MTINGSGAGIIDLGGSETTYESDCPPETRFAYLLCEGQCRATAKHGKAITSHRWERNKKVWDGGTVGLRHRTLRATYNEFQCTDCGHLRPWGCE